MKKRKICKIDGCPTLARLKELQKEQDNDE